MSYQISLSNAEILDRVSILSIKKIKIQEPSQNLNIVKELENLYSTFDSIIDNNQYIKNLYDRLVDINTQLWDIHNKIRAKEKKQIFDNQFIDLARSTYMLNDERALIKKQINIISSSELSEEKSYESY